MRHPLWLALVVLSIITAHSQASLKPSALVSQQKNYKGKFEKVNLFQPSAKKKNVSEVSKYEIMRLDAEELQKLVFSAPSSFILNLASASKNNLELELVKVDLFSEGFTVYESQTNGPAKVEHGAHYRGIIKGDKQSMVSVSIFEDEVMGLITSNVFGNLVLGKLEGQKKGAAQDYILYNDKDLKNPQEFSCGTPDDGPDYTKEELKGSIGEKTAGDCVKIYFEVDYDIYQNKGGTTGATNYVTALFNEVATLYAAENVNLTISEIFVWSTPSPYSGSSSSTLLTQFQNTRTSFNGDLAQLLSFQASGGIAVLGGLCHSFNSAKMSFSSIGSSFTQVPNYSFSVLVVAHELGHLLGSHHTHACVWNGNNSAIDGCAGFTEGSCSIPGTPSGGGTIMSYCHITSAGINLGKGFGTQPGNVIRSRIANANCTQVCSTGGGGSGGGGGGDNGGGSGTTCTDVTFTLTLDNYPMETSWKIKDANGLVVASGDSYDKPDANKRITENLCLDRGCYTFEIMDAYGDGICCDHGQGSFSLVEDATGNNLVSGAEFTNMEMSNFCIDDEGDDGDNGGGNSNCIAIDFSKYTIESYGGSQDKGTHGVPGSGNTIKLQDNAWKYIALNYNITPNTVLEFDFSSTIQGEIHGIGFDDNNTISYSLTFKVHGTQNWGVLDFDDYPNDQAWKHYTIPVGQYYTGEADRIFFVADQDRSPSNGNSFFRNVRIHEGNGCSNIVSNPVLDLNETEKASLELAPNPAQKFLNLKFDAPLEGNANIQVYNLVGQLVKTVDLQAVKGANRNQMDIADLSQGSYILRLDNGAETMTTKFNVTRK